MRLPFGAAFRGASSRLADQIAWSLAFFLLNAAALAGLSTPMFSAVAVGTAIGFIAVAVARSMSTTAGIIEGAERGVKSIDTVDRRRALGYSTGIAAIAVCVTVPFLSLSPEADSWLIGMVVFLMVLADTPRQVLVVAGRYARALAISATYLGLSLAGSAAILLGLPVLVVWVSVLALVLGVGWAIALSQGTRTGACRTADSRLWRHAWRLGAEAIYYGLAGQVGLLVLFGLRDDAAAAALRVSYALVFAPAFSVIQGLTPLFVRRLSDALVEGMNDGRRTLGQWTIFVVVGVLACGAASALWLPLVAGVETADSVMPFLLPVGLSVVSGQLLEAAVLRRRLLGETRGLHTQRLLLAGADISVQVSGVFLGGAFGLVAAIGIMSLVRIASSLWYVRAQK
jgi:hypothetical protein